MSSIASGINAERTNRWLLIGAAVLAVIAGVLVFAALANFSGDDDSASVGSGSGDAEVLVATRDISAGTTLDDSMFETAKVSEEGRVTGYISDSELASGKVAREDIYKGEQLTSARVGTEVDDEADYLTYKVPAGKRAMAVSVEEESSVAGLLVPGDRVDVVAVFEEDLFGRTDNDTITRVETLLQNVEVLAFAQEDLDAVTATNPEGETTDDTAGPDNITGQRPTDLDPNPGASTATLALSPQEVQIIAAAQADAVQITLVLRPFGDEDVVPLDEINLDDFGFLGPIARP